MGNCLASTFPPLCVVCVLLLARLPALGAMACSRLFLGVTSHVPHKLSVLCHLFLFWCFYKMIRVINFKLMKAEMSSHGLCVRLTAFYCLRDRRRIWISTICLQGKDCFFHPHAELFYLSHSLCVCARAFFNIVLIFFNLLILTFLLRVHFWLTLLAFDKILLPYMRSPPSVLATLYHRPSTIL